MSVSQTVGSIVAEQPPGSR